MPFEVPTSICPLRHALSFHLYGYGRYYNTKIRVARGHEATDWIFIIAHYYIITRMREIGTMYTISTLPSDTPLLQKKVSYGFLPKEKKH